MRRLFLTLLGVLLLVPAAAIAGQRAPGDGALVVREANARYLKVTGRGTIFGRFDHGTMTIVDYNRDDSVEPQVVGAEQTTPAAGLGAWTYKGSDVKFRFFGGRYTIKFSGTGIALSAVGKGTIWVSGNGTFDDGDYAVNGGKFTPISILPDAASFGSVTVTP